MNGYHAVSLCANRFQNQYKNIILETVQDGLNLIFFSLIVIFDVITVVSGSSVVKIMFCFVLFFFLFLFYQQTFFLLHSVILTLSNFHYIQSFSLTECIVIIGERKYLGCLCVCVSVCVCLSVKSREPKLLGGITQNFVNMAPSRSSCVRLSFDQLTLLMTSWPPF